MKKIYIFDTTLRDGSQKENLNFSLSDKLTVASQLNKFGIDYIEGGWPGSNPKDYDFFKQAVRNKSLKNKLVAFCSTRRKNLTAEKDNNLQAILKSGVAIAAMVGKTSAKQVKKVLQATLDQNLNMISDSVKFLTQHGIKVIFDAEHFFDGFNDNPKYALACLKTASLSGATNLSLCDTKGSSLPSKIYSIIKRIKPELKTSLGIHTHNDSGLAVAGSLAAVEAGANLIQGTINGYGERCGNADLTSLIPNLQIKMNYSLSCQPNLKRLTSLSKNIAEIANQKFKSDQPFVGKSAFAHKGGLHVSALRRQADAYEHIDPKLVGNQTRILVSELAGSANLKEKLEEWQIDFNDQSIRNLLKVVKDLEKKGYSFEAAEESLLLIYKKLTDEFKPGFKPLTYRIKINTKNSSDNKQRPWAEVKLKVGQKIVSASSQGNGPVNALDLALRKALVKSYPQIKKVKLLDYKVRILNGDQGTQAVVRVLINSTNGQATWSTVGVSTDIIEASWGALIDSLEYCLLL